MNAQRDAAINAYREAAAAGASVLIRPVAPFDGLDAVVRRVAERAPGPLLVGDLIGSPLVEAAVEHPSPAAERADEPLLAFHTSGSTGRPKCVVYRRSVVTAHAHAIAERLDLGVDDTTWVALPPPGYAYGLSIVHSHDVAGVPVRFVDAVAVLPDLSEGGAHPLGVYILPQHTPVLLSSGLDGEAVRHVVVAGGRLSGAAAAVLTERFPQAWLTNMYGQAELGPRLSTWRGRPADFVEGTIGSPLPGVDLVVDEGEFRARTPYAMDAYLPAPYDRVLPGPGRTFVATRDRGLVGPDGVLRHEGRADHVINVAGTKVDAHLVRGLIERAFEPLVVRVDSRPARVGGDSVPVVQIVPGRVPVASGAVRRELHGEFGSLAALCDIRIVDRLEVGESGK